jgi:hypothetical protein
MDGKTRSRSLIVTVSALVLAIGAIGIGVASAQATGDTFTGCLKGGTLTKVAIGSEPLSPCSQSSTKVSWNETGTPGVLGFYTNSLDISKSLNDDQQTNGTATCDTGDVATGGGFNAYTAGASDAQAVVRYNRPEGENGWHVEVDNFTGQPVAVYADVFVRCADVTP